MGELTQQAVAGLAAKFDLKHGAEVNRFVRKAFQEESKKSDCDEASCYRRIAAQYHAEKIVALRLVQIETEHYLVTLNVYDVLAASVSLSQKRECASCTFEKIKTLTGELVNTVLESE